MSSTEETEASDACCANCGIPEVDEVKLLEDGDGYNYKSVRCCGDKCKEENREQHDGECKKKETEVHDDNLFRQPDDSHFGECPLCFLPMPLDSEKSTFYSCCSKLVCQGCNYVHHKRNGGSRCPFCREPLADEEENHKRQMKRAKANDPAALCHLGTKRYVEEDWHGAFRYLTRAAELGDAVAHYQLGGMYWKGEGVKKDDEKKVYHLEKAAMGGHPSARHNLACVEHENGNMERAVKHLIIAANLGYEKSMKELWKQYSTGNITKDDLEATLRAHKAALDEMKSPEREAAKNWKIRR